MWERVNEDDPERCQGVGVHGQCINRAVGGGKFCMAHGGNRAVDNQKKEELRNYRLSKFKARIGELGNSDNITSLKDEVAILRILIEEKINSCADNFELMMASGPLSDLIMKVEKVVVSCNRLESRLGNLLDRTKISQFANIIVQIIGDNISDESTLETISDEILQALKEL